MSFNSTRVFEEMTLKHNHCLMGKAVKAYVLFRLLAYRNIKSNKRNYYNLVKQFYNSRLCKNTFKGFKNNHDKNVSVYMIGSFLFCELKKNYESAWKSLISLKALPTIFEEDKDFSFMDCVNNESLENFAKKVKNVFLAFGFQKIKKNFENLATSRNFENNQASHSRKIFEKTENISKRVFNLMNQITDKGKNDVPRLNLIPTENNNIETIMSKRSNDLEEEIFGIKNNQNALKVFKNWKKYIYRKKSHKFKVFTIELSRNHKSYKKIIHN